MNVRRATGAVIALVSFVAMAVVAHTARPRIAPAFASLLPPSMPFVPGGPAIATTWFCPGMPSGADGVSGELHAVNPTTSPHTARITAFAEDAPPVTSSVALPAASETTTSISELQPNASFVAALVEIDGAGPFVEQQANHPAGNAVSGCANSTSSSWYLPDGFTADTSTETLLITNPFPADASVDITFVTAAAARHPQELQQFPVPALSVAAVQLDQFALNEPVVAVQVTSSRGRVVVGRAQHYLGAGRLGFAMSLAVPSLTDQAYFADGESGDGITERYSIFNGSDDDVSVTVVFLGLAPSAGFANDTTIDVPAGQVVTLDTKDVAGLPAGRHAAVFSTLGIPSVAVERALTRTTPDGPITTVVAGAPPAFAVTRWSMAIGPASAVDGTLVVLNVDNVDATVTVMTVAAEGETPVAGLESVALPAAGVITITVPAEAVGRPLIVQSTQRVYVERLLPRGEGKRGRSGSFALAG